jgi:hypothetical protein
MARITAPRPIKKAQRQLLLAQNMDAKNVIIRYLAEPQADSAVAMLSVDDANKLTDGSGGVDTSSARSRGPTGAGAHAGYGSDAAEQEHAVDIIAGAGWLCHVHSCACSCARTYKISICQSFLIHET